jgi:hypothetical protein
MYSILAGDRAESGGCQSEAAAKRAREMRRLAVAHQTRDIRHRDCGLLDQQCSRRAHAPLEQVLVKTLVAELRVGPLELARRARQRFGNGGQREVASVVLCHDHAGEQIQPPPRDLRLWTHILDYDQIADGGTVCR